MTNANAKSVSYVSFKKWGAVLLAVLLAFSVIVVNGGSSAFAESEAYIVQPGDTLSKIAAKHGLDWKGVAEVNKLENPNLIFPGTKIVLNDKAEEYDTRDLNEHLVMATAWVQNSAEFRALSYQSFNMAKILLDLDLANNPSEEKRAVIVDVDETVLDNSPYQAALVDENYGYSKNWIEWINQAVAEPFPGAVEFLKYADEKGVDIYYISNRKQKTEFDGTFTNLKDKGFPQVQEDHVLLRTAESTKTPRRELVDKDHRIVLLIGDNLNDFSDVFEDKSTEERFKVTDQHKDDFGTKLIVLPNPMYGDWEGALYDFNWGATPKEKEQMRKQSLKRATFE